METKEEIVKGMGEDLDKKYAKLVMKLKAKSGYSCTQEQEISVNQWKDINLVLSGKLQNDLQAEKIIELEKQRDELIERDKIHVEKLKQLQNNQNEIIQDCADLEYSNQKLKEQMEELLDFIEKSNYTHSKTETKAQELIKKFKTFKNENRNR